MITANVAVNSQNKVKIQGSMSAVMAKKAQYVIQKLDEAGNPEPDQEVYLNIETAPGGVNDGSGFITGRPGTTIVKFNMAGKNGGCAMSSSTLKNKNCKNVNFDLVLCMRPDDVENNVFRLFDDGEMTEVE